MVPEEPTGYEDEPREQFQELPAELLHLLYHYERVSQDLTQELSYYRSQLQQRCTRLLELGCGTGLLSNNLQGNGLEVTGIDLDRRALSFSKGAEGRRLVQMDMRHLGLRPGFDAVLIGQNTLNLLTEPADMKHCLQEIRRILVPPGLLLAHLYCSDSEHQAHPEGRLLQFHLFDHPEGGKIIKESIRSYDPKKRRLYLEQRFKIRRCCTELPDYNYRHCLELAALSRREWLELFNSAGFFIESWSPGFAGVSVSPHSTLHLVARSEPSSS